MFSLSLSQGFLGCLYLHVHSFAVGTSVGPPTGRSVATAPENPVVFHGLSLEPLVAVFITWATIDVAQSRPRRLSLVAASVADGAVAERFRQHGSLAAERSATNRSLQGPAGLMVIGWPATMTTRGNGHRCR